MGAVHALHYPSCPLMSHEDDAVLVAVANDKVTRVWIKGCSWPQDGRACYAPSSSYKLVTLDQPLFSILQ